MIRFECITPTIGISDWQEAMAYYSKLGFELEWKWPEQNPSHASFRRDVVNFMVVFHNDIQAIQKGNMNFQISGTRESFDFVQSHGLNPSPLIQTDYGMTEFSVYDPLGHHFVFGQPTDHSI